MKRSKSIYKNCFIAFFFFSTSIVCIAQFEHPGILHNKAELDFVRNQIKDNNEPWASLFKKLKDSEYGQLNWMSKAVEEINVGYNGKPNLGGSEFMSGGDAAYTMALLWYFTNDTAYAEKSISIMNNWSYILKSIINKNRKLIVAISGIKYLVAAEIIKHTYNNWSFDDERKFKEMVMNVWFPLIKDFGPTYNGNWDAAMVQTMMAIGIYFDDEGIFHRSYTYVLNGKSNGAIDNYIAKSGQCQESGRDQVHVQMGLGYLAMTCEIAFKQGFDLYYGHFNRLAQGYEYTARYLLGEEVEFQQFISFQGKNLFGKKISPQGRDKILPVFEIAFRHYHYRMGLDMPYSNALIEKNFPMLGGGGTMPWSSLMNQSSNKAP